MGGVVQTGSGVHLHTFRKVAPIADFPRLCGTNERISIARPNPQDDA